MTNNYRIETYYIETSRLYQLTRDELEELVKELSMMKAFNPVSDLEYIKVEEPEFYRSLVDKGVIKFITRNFK